MRLGPSPVEVTSDRAPVYPRVLDELVPGARHVLEQYANNVVEADHGRLNARLRPMRGLTTIRSARTIAAGHAFVQHLRRGHYELGADLPRHDRMRVAFTGGRLRRGTGLWAAAAGRGRDRGDAVRVVEGEYVLGISAFWHAQFGAARTHFQAAVAHYRPEHREIHIVRYGTDPKVVCLSRLANTLWFLGRPDDARQARDAALAHAEEIDHPNSLGTAQVFAALLALDMGDWERFRRYAAALFADRDRHARPNQLAAEAFGGLAEVLDGHPAAGIARIHGVQNEADTGAYAAPGMAGALARVLLEAAAAAGDAMAVVAAADRLLATGRGAQIWEATAQRPRARSLAAVGEE